MVSERGVQQLAKDIDCDEDFARAFLEAVRKKWLANKLEKARASAPAECPVCGATEWDYELTPEGHVTTCCRQGGA